MSEIPFVQALGDAIDAAVAKPRRSRRRWVAAAVTVFLLGGGVAVARFLASPTDLATSSIGCYEGPSLEADIDVVDVQGRSPVATCARVFRQIGGPKGSLVACAHKTTVYVFPGRGAAVCRRLGLTPLPAGYAAARARVLVLQRRIEALENRSNCIPPDVLVRRVDALLLRSGWIGWHAYVLHNSLPVGPCGSVSTLDGGGRRGITGSLDSDTHQVTVFTGPPRGLSRSPAGRTHARRSP